MVKIDLGVHLGGYISTVASTVIVGATKENPITGPVADCVMACHYAIEGTYSFRVRFCLLSHLTFAAMLRMVRPGAKSEDITKAIQKIAEDFKCKVLLASSIPWTCYDLWTLHIDPLSPLPQFSHNYSRLKECCPMC